MQQSHFNLQLMQISLIKSIRLTPQSVKIPGWLQS